MTGAVQTPACVEPIREPDFTPSPDAHQAELDHNVTRLSLSGALSHARGPVKLIARG